MNLISNAYHNVYNYMTSQTTGRHTNKYDAHKKSELRSIYNSIVKMSKDSPIYIFDHSDEARNYAINIKEEARSLKNTLSALDAAEDSGSLLGQKIAVSSNPDQVSVEYLGGRPAQDDTRIELDVSRLATPQVNTGNALAPNRLKLMPGSYSFDIQTGGLSYNFQFQVSHKDTNSSIQDRLANLITKSNIGIYADVAEDEDGNRALRLTSEATGTTEQTLRFRVTEDTDSPQSGAVRYFGMDQVSAPPENAVFSINGGETHENQANAFTINRSFAITLHNTTNPGEPVTIGFKPDIETVNDNIREVARKYNSLIHLSGSYAGEQIRSNLLGQNISSAAKQYRNSLEAIGLQLSDEGTLEVDDQLLNQALTEDMDDTVQSVLDFKSALTSKTDAVMLNPMDYVDRKIVAYPNPGKSFANPYVTSIYSGMLFNSYC